MKSKDDFMVKGAKIGPPKPGVSFRVTEIQGQNPWISCSAPSLLLLAEASSYYERVAQNALFSSKTLEPLENPGDFYPWISWVLPLVSAALAREPKSSEAEANEGASSDQMLARA